jgi:UDP-N-acetylglucosamine 2-epimerase
MKIISIVGARPQFIKAGVISRKIREKGIKEILLHTGQHYDFNMSDVFFKELNIPKPDYYSGIGSGSHGEQTGKMLIEIERILLEEKPEAVVVYGDTNSTLAGALAAAKLHISVAHVEAGLRSFNKKMPEEINRVLTDHISDILFAPSDIAVENLKKEGIVKGVYKVGDVMLDIALEVSGKVEEKRVLVKYGLKSKEFILVTIHRAENTNSRENLENIWKALNKLAKDGIDVFFPIHPGTEKVLQRYGLFIEANNLKVVPPVSYFEMVVLEKNARLIITDSGGVQKEGYFFGTPCIIPREETEWVELVELGFNKLTGANTFQIYSKVQELWNKNIELEKSFKGIYGDGKSSEKIGEALKKWINQK